MAEVAAARRDGCASGWRGTSSDFRSLLYAALEQAEDRGLPVWNLWRGKWGGPRGPPSSNRTPGVHQVKQRPGWERLQLCCCCVCCVLRRRSAQECRSTPPTLSVDRLGAPVAGFLASKWRGGRRTYCIFISISPAAVVARRCYPAKFTPRGPSTTWFLVENPIEAI